MQVIKKSGFRQPYDISKVKIALQKTAKSIGEDFKESDWRELKPRILARLEPIMEGKEEIFFWEIDDAVIDSLLRSRFKEIAKEYIQSRSRIRQDKLNDLGLNQLSMWLLKERYLKKDTDGNPIETAREMMCRVATTIASVEKTSKLREEYSKKFTDMLCNLDFLPNSPCLVSSGTNRRGTLAACFAFEIEDSLESIFQVLKDTAKTFQMGGGVGINISKLREKGAYIRTSNGYSSGPIAFLQLFNTMVETVKAGGFRRGALLAMMKYNHPDILEFITCKKSTTELNNMNISILIDDEFLDAVNENRTIEFISPRDKKSKGKILASILLEEIAANMWATGEPGILYYDNINKDNPTPHLGDIKCVNPCFGPHEKLLTLDGYKTFESLEGRNTEIIGSDNKIYKAKIMNTGYKETVKLMLSNKESIICTPNHIWVTNNNIQEQAVNLLGERLLPFLNHSDFNNLYIKLGFIQGDGQLTRLNSIHHKGMEINIGEKDEDILRFFNLQDKNSNHKEFSFYVNGFNELCKELGFSPKPLPKREFPTTYYGWERVNKLSFLRGIYSANGCVIRKYRISLKSTCKKFIEQLKNALSEFDIYSYITTNKPTKVKFKNGVYECKESYDLNIGTFSGILKFHNLIGFIQQYRQKNLLDLILMKSPKVLRIEENGYSDVYDFVMDEHHLGVVKGCITHNCSESTLLHSESCNLGSINLTKHIKDSEIDWDKLANTIKLAIRFLDNMIDASPYPTDEVRRSVLRTRKIGLGVMGFADILILLGIKYSSKEALEVAGKIMSFTNDVAGKTSEELGKEKGLYEAYKDGCPRRRNSIVTTQAPTGSISLIAGVSSGIEPNFAKEYTRIIGSEIVKVSNPSKDNKMFETYLDVPMRQHLLVLSEFQKYVENSVSKTLNLPETTTVNDIKSLIIEAHNLGVKGITIFREKCQREPLIKCEECQI